MKQSERFVVPVNFGNVKIGKTQVWVFPKEDVEILFSFGYPVAGWAADFGGWFVNETIPEKYMKRVANGYAGSHDPEEVEQQRIFDMLERFGYGTTRLEEQAQD